MVILGQDGEKWACEACLKGHRVSSCTHKDRQLFHVNKKGRPVSQCQHCRGLRKSRAAHVKCVCAEHGIGKDDKPGGQRCQCVNDRPCTCSVKRETLQGDDLQKAAARNLTHRRAHSHGKPAMLNRRSDSLVPSRPPLGHHPPLHRNNNAAHETGFPYTIPKFTASTPSIDLLGHSTESLPLVPPHRPGGLHRASLSTSNLPQTFAPVLPSSAPPDHRSESLSSLTTPADTEYQPDYNFMSNSVSPGNPARYSLNEMPMFSLNEFGDNGTSFQSQPLWTQQMPSYGPDMLYRQSSFAASTGQLPEWPELSNAESPQSFQPGASISTPQRSSVVSMDQPGLTHSPSNTASDAESYGQHPVPQPAAMNSQPWTAKEYVDPHALDVGPASYTSTAQDLSSYRSGTNEYWPDYFQTGPASSVAESVHSGIHNKQDMDEMPHYAASTPSGFDGAEMEGDMTGMNYNWESYNMPMSPSYGQ